MAQSYAAGIVGAFAQDMHPTQKPPLVLLTRDWFNPTLESRWFIVPGLVCVLSLVMSLLIARCRWRANASWAHSSGCW